jgi:hypothetical protein
MNTRGKMAWFRIANRAIGPGWQVRVRTFSGAEEMVDIVYSLEDARRRWDELSESMIPLSERP